MPNIQDLYASIPGLKQDFKSDWKEDARADWKIDWDAVPGDAAGAAPVNTVLPAITGTAQVGETLTASTGTWTGNPAPTYSYQWLVDGVEAEAATFATYEVRLADEGLTITVEVTATNSEGSASVESAATAAVVPA